MGNKKEILKLRKEFDLLRLQVLCGIKTSGHQFRLIAVYLYDEVFWGKFKCPSCFVTKTCELDSSEIKAAKKLGYIK